MIFFTIGVFLLSFPSDINNKIAITLIFIGMFIFLFFPEKSINNHNDIYVFTFLIAWLILITIITNDENLDIYFFSMVLGMLIIKEFANGYIQQPLKRRLRILTLVFFAFSMILVAEKVISFFSM